MLSKELADSEVNKTLSTLMTRHEVERAFDGTPVGLPPVTDIAANAPTPLGGAHKMLFWGLVALVVAAIAIAQVTTTRTVLSTFVTVPPGAPPAADGSGATLDSEFVTFTDQFQLVANKNIAITLTAHIDNDWAYSAGDLVNVDTGEVTSFDANLEYYHGYEDGESWTEGHPDVTQFIGPRAAGTYMLRLESQHGASRGQTSITVEVRQGVVHRRTIACVAAAIIAAIVLIYGAMR